MRYRVVCVVSLIAIMTLWIVVHARQLATVDSMITEVDRQQEQIGIHLARKELMEAERTRLEDRQRLIEQLAGDASLVVVLGEIGRRQPETVVLTELSAQCPTLSRYREDAEPAVLPGRTGPSQRRGRPEVARRDDRPEVSQITITGIARDIPDVIEFSASLESSPLFDRVQREMKKEKSAWAGRRVQQFKLICDLVRQAGKAP